MKGSILGVRRLSCMCMCLIKVVKMRVPVPQVVRDGMCLHALVCPCTLLRP